MAGTEDLWDEMFAACIAALRSGKHEIVFQHWEQNYSEFLSKGEEGIAFHGELLDVVTKAGKPELVLMFQLRFDRLLSRGRLFDKLVSEYSAALSDEEQNDASSARS
jgi:hypothetical protein